MNELNQSFVAFCETLDEEEDREPLLDSTRSTRAARFGRSLSLPLERCCLLRAILCVVEC